MAEISKSAVKQEAPPTTRSGRVRHIGPGLIVAATGVGAGDLVATMVAGAEFGTILLWAAIVGAVLKLGLAEGVGRWHLGSGTTMMDGWRVLGRWATGFFGIYIVIFGFVYGATAMSATGLSLNALFGGLSVRYWAMIAGAVGLALVWLQRYQMFEKFIAVLVGVMFLSVVSIAVLVTPDIGDLFNGLVPRMPEGSLIYVLGLIGGVGGTITIAAYGYWVLNKGWRSSGWMSVMRLDNATGYVLTAIFVVAMLIVGAEFLLGQSIVDDDEGLLFLGSQLGEQYGEWARIIFLIGFFAVVFTSLLGALNGVALMFADWVRSVRKPHGRKITIETDVEEYEHRSGLRSLPFRAFILWMTFPPMLLLFLDRPFAVTLVYGVLGAFFMPFLAATLLLLLNTRRVEPAHRSGWLSNAVLGLSLALFAVLMVNELIDQISSI